MFFFCRHTSFCFAVLKFGDIVSYCFCSFRVACLLLLLISKNFYRRMHGNHQRPSLKLNFIPKWASFQLSCSLSETHLLLPWEKKAFSSLHPPLLNICTTLPGYLFHAHTTAAFISTPFNQISPCPMGNLMTKGQQFIWVRMCSRYFLLSFPDPLSTLFYPALYLGRSTPENCSSRLPCLLAMGV